MLFFPCGSEGHLSHVGLNLIGITLVVWALGITNARQQTEKNEEKKTWESEGGGGVEGHII